MLSMSPLSCGRVPSPSRCCSSGSASSGQRSPDTGEPDERRPRPADRHAARPRGRGGSRCPRRPSSGSQSQSRRRQGARCCRREAQAQGSAGLGARARPARRVRAVGRPPRRAAARFRRSHGSRPCRGARPQGRELHPARRRRRGHRRVERVGQVDPVVRDRGPAASHERSDPHDLGAEAARGGRRSAPCGIGSAQHPHRVARSRTRPRRSRRPGAVDRGVHRAR